MASIQLQTNLEHPGSRPMSQQGFHHHNHHSPAISPKLARPASQTSLHLAPVSISPALPPDTMQSANNGPLTSFPGQFRPFTPAAASMTLPMPHNHFAPPTTAPPLSYFPQPASASATATGPIFSGQQMMRTVSHGHPMHSATEHTASTRYSPSPHSAGGLLHQHHESPPSASLTHHNNTFPMSSLHQQQQPTINIQQDSESRAGHVNPSLFWNPNSGANYPMSRSTSGASASEHGNDMGRLLTPHYEYRDDLRKVSDPMQGSQDRLYPASYATNYQNHGGHGLGLGPHPQPTEIYYRGNPYGDHYAMSSERSDVKPNIGMMANGAETDYERERQEQIMNNKRLMEEVGLGDQSFSMRQRDASGPGHGQRGRKPTLNKKRSPYNGPVRASGRIASVARTSYAELDGGDDGGSNSSDEYQSDEGEYDDDEFRPAKKPRGRTGYAQQRSYSSAKPRRSVELSLYGLLQVYPEIPHLFPLFYYTLNNDLTINPDSVPLIGSIPSTCSPVEKAEGLRRYFHRGRRVLQQLDAFTMRCDRKYEGPEDKWAELDYHTRIAVRDVRRKVVERCENYKYTRRDILDKAMGKNNWQPIEVGMIEWKAGGNSDPANDLANVTLTLPTPPASAYHQQHQQPRVGSVSAGMGSGTYPQHPGRTIRPFPRRPSNRIMSVTMGEYTPALAQTPHTGMPYYAQQQHQQQQPQTAPPMYGEDEVPMTVQLPSGNGNGIMSATTPQLQPQQLQQQQPLMPMSSPDTAPTPAAWEHRSSLTPVPPAAATPITMTVPAVEPSQEEAQAPRGIKRSRSAGEEAEPETAAAAGEDVDKADESDDDDEDGDGDNDSAYAA